MHDQYYLFDIHAYGEIVQMQAREVVWKYRIAGSFTVPNIVGWAKRSVPNRTILKYRLIFDCCDGRRNMKQSGRNLKIGYAKMLSQFGV